MEYQAILVTAYKDFEHLEELICFFEGPFRFYIHIDKKIVVSAEEIEILETYSQVCLISRKYNVNWGGRNHLKAILHLAEEAVKSSSNYYFHLISGLDFPIKSPNYFLSFFRKNRNRAYIDFFDVPFPGWADSGGLDRLQYYNFYDLLDSKNYTQNVWIKRFVTLQKKLGLKRGFNYRMPKLYGGSTWWSMSREALEHVLKFTKKHPWFLKRFRFSLCAEEFYIQTILINSKFVNRVINKNLRYIDWIVRNGNNPAILDMSDYTKIIESDAVFARKFDKLYTKELFEKIKKKLI